MTPSRPDHPRLDDDDESVPAGPGARLLLTATPFVAVGVVWIVLRWLLG